MSLSVPVRPSDEDGRFRRGQEYFAEDQATAIDALTQKIAALQSALPDSRSDLVDAWIYKAVVHLHIVDPGSEATARQCFKEALHLDPTLRLYRPPWSANVVREFDAARKGETKSVWQAPNTTVKKAGIGGATVALIVGGVAALAGGAAVAASHGSSSTPTPAPTPTPNPDTLVTPLVRTGDGAETIDFLSADPPPGTTLGRNQPVNIGLVIRNADPAKSYSLLVSLAADTSAASCQNNAFLQRLSSGGSSFQIGVALPGFSCAPHTTLTVLTADLSGATGGNVKQTWKLKYPLSDAQ